jgi:hypothetical protein
VCALSPPSSAQIKEKIVITITDWFSEPHDADLADIYSLCRAVANAHNVQFISFAPAPHGSVIVVWKGDPDASISDLHAALEKEWNQGS